MISGTKIERKMSVHEEYSKLNANSPELSVPSATSASYASSPESFQEDDSKNESVRRTLFEMSNEGFSPLNSFTKAAGFVSSPNTSSIDGKAVLSPSGDENGAMDTGSTTSSQTTAIPAWNLSMKDAAEKNVEVPLNDFILSQPIPLLTSPISFSSDRTQTPSSPTSPSSTSDRSDPLYDSESQWTIDSSTTSSPKRLADKENKQPSIIMEDPPEEPTSCNAALNLTPVQLAEIFLAFGQSARQRYQGSEQAEKATTATFPEPSSPIKGVSTMSDDTGIGSPPPLMKSSHLSDSSNGSDKSQGSVGFSRVLFLQRELDVLKTSSQRDAHTILNLKQTVDSQKQLNSLKEVDIAGKQTEIQIAEEQISTLQKEHEDYIERETELVETIVILKNELDKITLLKSAPSDELDHIMTEESAPASDKIESECIDTETNLEASRVKEQHDRIIELENVLKEKEKENFRLITQIDWLNSKKKGAQDNVKDHTIEEKESPKSEASPSIEVEGLLKDIMERLEVMENEKKVKQLDNTEISGNIIEESENIQKVRSIESEHNGVKVDVSQDPNAIEAMSVIQKLDNGNDSGNQSTWCCDWSIITGE